MDKKTILKKYTGKGGRIKDSLNIVASKVANLSGGKDLVDYAGSKIAKMRAPADQKKYVADNTSGKKALLSAGKVGLTIASIIGAGKLASTGLNILKKQGLKNIVRKKIPVKSDPLEGSRGVPGINWGDRPMKITMKPTREILSEKLNLNKLRGTMKGRTGIGFPKSASKTEIGNLKTKLNQERHGSIRKTIHEKPDAYGPMFKTFKRGKLK